MSVAGPGIKVVANCGVHFHRGTPIYDSPALIRTDPLGDQVAATLGDRNAVLLRGHGGTVVAGDLDTLLRLGLDLVRAARIQIMACSLGPVKTHSQEECEQVVRFHGRPNANRRYVDYYISEVVPRWLIRGSAFLRVRHGTGGAGDKDPEPFPESR